jgi:23S rRNA (adenine2503-C2)-methyltransferase
VVFMGMGEPLVSLPRVVEAIRRMVEEMGMSPRSLTVSTVGIVPGIHRLADLGWPLNLAISLHAADDELRSRLVPINRRYPLSDLVAAGCYYHQRTGRRVSIEWTMIAEVNDTDEQARRLADIARRMRAHVNLIALNPTPLTAHVDSPPERIRRFVEILQARRVKVTVRDTRGRDIDAACGQLRVANRPTVPPGSGRDPSRTAPSRPIP